MGNRLTEGTSSGNQFSPSAVPVAKFDWQPLSEGEFSLPAINITAITYGGKKVDVPFPVYKVSVSPKKETQYKTLMQKKPELAMRLAVRGMLQKNTIADWQLKRLRVFRGAEHDHAAQKPEVWDR